MTWYDWIFWVVWALGILIILAYAFVLPFGAPYLPTMKNQRENALDLLGLRPGQTLVDLGSGDGSILVLAAQHKLHAVGYEINPFLFIFSWLRTRRYGRKVKIKFRSFWQADLSQADGVFVFLITHHLKRLDRLLTNNNLRVVPVGREKPLKVVSHAFKIPGKKHLKKSGALFLYQY